MADVIELRHVSKTYYTGAIETRALDDVNLSFEEGSFNSIIGASGSGKSTLLNILGTLDRPTEGEVYVDGRRADAMSNNELADLRNKTIGFVFQFHYLLSEFTAKENVLIPHWVREDMSPEEAARRADELMALMGLSDVKDNPASKMSGGQQQRTAIARALMTQPKLVLADEPTGNLDSDNSDRLYKVFRDINEKFGTTFVIVTHDRRIAEKTDRIVEIKDGRIELDLSR